jgi:hypothetical protein
MAECELGFPEWALERAMLRLLKYRCCAKFVVVWLEPAALRIRRGSGGGESGGGGGAGGEGASTTAAAAAAGVVVGGASSSSMQQQQKQEAEETTAKWRKSRESICGVSRFELDFCFYSLNIILLLDLNCLSVLKFATVTICL